MDELARLMEWDLQAIVGCSSTEGPAGAATMIMDNPHLSFSHFCPECSDDLLCNFHGFSETTTVVDELEELYKPFYPDLSIVTSSQPVPEEVQVLKPSDKVAVQDLQDIDPEASKCKTSKKNQKKKRVQHVTAADGVSDQWSWRKYGQKPIKGSPYPRSYYRCSSSKGCLARKQVERSHLDPAVFIVTYTAEHSHPHYPARKNSQARNTAKNRSTIAPSGTHDQLKFSPPGTPLVVESNTADHEHAPSVELEQQSKGVKKEEGVVEGDDGWFPSIEVQELNGLDQQLALDGYGFMDSTFAETCFG